MKGTFADSLVDHAAGNDLSLPFKYRRFYRLLHALTQTGMIFTGFVNGRWMELQSFPRQYLGMKHRNASNTGLRSQ